jgi:hypothetical protein
MLGTCLQNGVPRAIVAAEAGDLLITEVMASPKSVTDTLGEWIEVYATTDVDLNGLSLATSTSRATLSSTDCLTVHSQTYNLLARSGDAFVNGGLPPIVSTFSVSLSSANERLRLVRGDAGIDEAIFFGSQDGVSWQVRPDLLANPDDIRVTLNDSPDSFCKASASWPDGGGDFGTPGAPNGACAADSGVVVVPDGGQPTFDCATINAGDLVVTEVMIDPASGDTGLEWFEVYNTTATPIDLAGLVLTYRQGATAPRTHLVRSSVVVPAGQAVAVGDVRSGPNPGWIRTPTAPTWARSTTPRAPSACAATRSSSPSTRGFAPRAPAAAECWAGRPRPQQPGSRSRPTGVTRPPPANTRPERPARPAR